MSEEKRYKIYVHTNKINGKRYVGLTSQRLLSERSHGGKSYKGCRYFYFAIQKYGWDNFSHEVLEFGLSKEEAREREKYYIALFDLQNPDNGYNIDNGGFVPVQLSKEGRKALSDANKRGNSPRARKLVSFDLTGKRLMEFDCVRDAEDFYGVKINYRHVKQQRGTCHNMIFRFKDDVGNLEFLPKNQVFKKGEQKLTRGENSWHSTPVVFFDATTGVRVAEFDCCVHAKDFVQGDISAALTGKHKTVGGYVCRRADEVIGIDVLPQSDLPVFEQNGKSVEQYLPDGTLVNRYANAVEAEAATGVSRKQISNCVRHRCQTGGGFVWRLSSDKSAFSKPKTTWETRRERMSRVLK